MKWCVSLVFVILYTCCTAQQASRDDQTCTASYYSDKFEGRKCASGEIFRQSRLTGAHKKLAFGTWVNVTNLKNGRSVVVRINDRLPQKSRRCIDVTKEAARRLGFTTRGVVKVKIRILKDSVP